MSRTDLTEYADNLSKWILNRVAKVTNADTGKVVVSNAYNPTTGNLDSVSKFGVTVQKITYNTDGTVGSVADNLNPATVFSNYKRGVPRSVTHPDATTESGEVNDFGAVTSHTDQYGYITRYDYDAAGRMSGVTYPTPDTVTWNKTTVTFSQVAGQELDLGGGHWKQVTQTGNGFENTYYDALWRPVYVERYDSTDTENTSRIVKRQYDFAGRKTFESYPQRNYQSISGGVYNEYDGLGRPTVRSTISELGTLYDGYVYSGGFKKTYTDAKGNNTYYSYQVFDQPTEDAITQIEMPENVLVNINRDIFGKTKSIVRSGGNLSMTRSYVYDDKERLCKTIEPETGATVQDYDGANNVAWRASGQALLSVGSCDTASVPDAKKAKFTYDALNRLKDTTFGDGSAAINRTYALDGLPETVTSNGSKWTYTYNKRRLLENESLAYGSATYSIGHGYDVNGSLAQIRYPVDNTTIAYDPNALGEARQVGTYATAISYHPSGAIAGFTYGNGIRRTMNQNIRGLPEIVQDSGVLNEKYTYDKNANVEKIEDLVAPNTATRSMGYDGLNRLRSTAAPGLWGTAGYDYDVLDNLIKTAITGGQNVRTTTHNVNPTTNRLDSITGGPANFSFNYGYDAQGNITNRGAQSYQFDLANRMTAAPGRGTYVYDGLGRRVSVVGTDGVNRIQVYSQAGQLLYVAPSGGTPTKYVYLHSHQIAEVK
jgi:YD repeat-containing protein